MLCVLRSEMDRKRKQPTCGASDCGIPAFLVSRVWCLFHQSLDHYNSLFYSAEVSLSRTRFVYGYAAEYNCFESRIWGNPQNLSFSSKKKIVRHTCQNIFFAYFNTIEEENSCATHIFQNLWIEKIY